jgi:hypothetical protein
MLRRETGQILPGLIMLMVAILGIGLLTFRIGRAAVLRSGAQTAADAAALAGARSVRDQLIAQMVTTGTSDLSRVSEVVVRLRAAEYAKRNGGRLTNLKLEGADVRVWVDTDDQKVDPPESERRGKATARGRVELIAAPGFGIGGGPLVGGGGGVGAYKAITEKEWKELEKDLKYPPDCGDLYKLGVFLKAHGAVPPYENARLGDPPMPPGGERSTTSWHYQCGNSGAIDLNYGGNEKAIIDSQIGWFHKLGFNTLWQVENHYDHIHINPPGGEGVGGAIGGGAAGPLQHTMLEIKLVDWNAPSPTGFAAGFIGGPGGIPFGPPNPQVARAMCEVLDRMNVSEKVRIAAWETAIVESGVKALDWGDRDSQGPFQQRPSQGWGTPEQVRDPYYATAAFVRAAKKIEHLYSDPGVLAQKVQISGFPERYGERAGQAAALNRKFCG